MELFEIRIADTVADANTKLSYAHTCIDIALRYFDAPKQDTQNIACGYHEIQNLLNLVLMLVADGERHLYSIIRMFDHKKLTPQKPGVQEGKA